jgi:radical SAM protein with 4Fe4S-binding SPASM domain
MQFTKNRVFSAPFSAMISVTNKCNLTCKYCCNNSTIDHNNDMSREEILDVLKQFAEMKIFIIHFTGGEMFLRKDVFDFFDALKPWQKFTMRTNGTCISKEQIDKLAKYTNSLGVGVSIDGSCEEVNLLTRGSGYFEKSLSTLEYMTKKGLWTNIMFTVTKYNYKDIENMAVLAQKIGCKLTLNKLDPIGRAANENNYGFTSHELEQLCNSIYEIDKKYQNVLQAESFISRHNYLEKCKAGTGADEKNLDRIISSCDIGFSFIHVESNGNVYPCSIMTEPILGNIRDESLKSIWTSSTQIQKIRDLKKMRLADVHCDKELCAYVSNCSPGCRAISQRLHNTLYDTDPYWCLQS